MKQRFCSLMAIAIVCTFMNSCTMEVVAPEGDSSGKSFTADEDILIQPLALPAVGQSKVAYYAFDATPSGQGILPLTTFTDNANVVIVFEGTLWELADTVHYNSGWMNNAYYHSKRQVLADIQTLRSRGVKVLMNVDDAASWSTATPFTTYNGTAYNATQFASFINSCVTTVGLDGISLDVEHGATANTNYRNLIAALGGYFGPLSSSPNDKMYTAAVYSGGAPGPNFREVSMSQYLNFVMDMAYSTDNFSYWSATLGNSRVMEGYSHQLSNLNTAIANAQWHPSPEKAGIMVFAANVSKSYTDAIFAALSGGGTTPPPAGSDITNYSGTLTAQYQTGSPSGEEYTKVIDNNTGTKYLTSHAAAWLRFQPASAAVVVKYTITSANDVPARDPKNWTLQGSNNGTSWTTLNTQTNQTFASRGLTKTYTFTNTTSYAHYRLNITAVGSGSIMQMAEWELFRN
ncbi:MAG TPA: glycosyl hydrolase family 18 protein [Chryseolinea sp.]